MMKKSKIIVLFIASILLSSLGAFINPAAGQPTTVKVDPPLTEYYAKATGTQFTVAVMITDVENLYGFDLKLRWNTTFLDYVSRSVHVPRDTYLDGVLWNPILPLADEVNTTEGTYWVSYASMAPAPSFNGTGTVFTMTFRVKYHPAQSTTEIPLELYSTDLSNKVGDPIPHTPQNGKVILYALIAGHDVAVTNLTSAKTVICQGYCGNLTVTVQNQGNFTENFNVTVYANTTSIATQTVTLSSGTSTTITFTWNTSGFAKGNYTISAYAWPVQGEIDTADNTLSDGVVLVGVPCDVTGPVAGVPDGVCNMRDIGYICNHFGTTPSSSNWDPNCDVTGPTPRVPDGVVNMRDIGEACSNFGKT